MMIFKKMFAEKILRFHEGMNRLYAIVVKFPHIGRAIEKQVAVNDNMKLKTAIGILAQMWEIFLEFLRKFIYVGIFIYIPYRIIAGFCPLIEAHGELAMIYLFFMLSTVCGSIANTTLLSMGERDYLMIRIMLISPYMNFLGKLFYKIASDFIYFTIILTIYGISFRYSLALSFVTAACRPVGEMFAIIMFEKIKSLYNNRGTYNGIVMAVCVLAAYGVPVLKRSISSDWMSVVHPVFAFLMMCIGCGAVFFLWKYKYYRKVMREAMYIKREM